MHFSPASFYDIKMLLLRLGSGQGGSKAIPGDNNIPTLTQDFSSLIYTFYPPTRMPYAPHPGKRNNNTPIIQMIFATMKPCPRLNLPSIASAACCISQRTLLHVLLRNLQTHTSSPAAIPARTPKKHPAHTNIRRAFPFNSTSCTPLPTCLNPHQWNSTYKSVIFCLNQEQYMIQITV